jgi:glycosyltransferase involved in cell wall biosynthesis
MRCLLVIPAFHESERLPPFLAELLASLDRADLPADVLVVDDGSGLDEQQRLAEVAAKLRPQHARLLDPLCLAQNRGKGGAIRAGWEKAAAEYDWVGFVDADGAIPATEVCRLLQLAFDSTEPSAIFGSRIRMMGKQIERSGLRHLSGRLFAFVVGMTITPLIYDSQCGIKLIPAAIYRRIVAWLAEDGFCFDVELLAALLAARAPVVEVPIDWTDRPGSKVSLFRDTTRMFLGVRRIKQRSSSWT